MLRLLNNCKLSNAFTPHLLERLSQLQAMGAEHRHTEKEVRYIKQGTCYFDVRDSEDKWIRIELGPGDHLVLPPKIYHRFQPSLDTTTLILVVPEGSIYMADYRHT